MHSVITLLKSINLGQIMSIFEEYILAPNLFIVICATSHPCHFNMKNERKMQHFRHPFMGQMRRQMKETHQRESIFLINLYRTHIRMLYRYKAGTLYIYTLKESELYFKYLVSCYTTCKTYVKAETWTGLWTMTTTVSADFVIEKLE